MASSHPASIGWNGAFKTQIDQVAFVDKDVDYTHRVVIADAVVEAPGNKVPWPRCSPSIKRFMGDPAMKFSEIIARVRGGVFTHAGSEAVTRAQ